MKTKLILPVFFLMILSLFIFVSANDECVSECSENSCQLYEGDILKTWIYEFKIKNVDATFSQIKLDVNGQEYTFLNDGKSIQSSPKITITNALYFLGGSKCPSSIKFTYDKDRPNSACIGDTKNCIIYWGDEINIENHLVSLSDISSGNGEITFDGEKHEISKGTSIGTNLILNIKDIEYLPNDPSLSLVTLNYEIQEEDENNPNEIDYCIDKDSELYGEEASHYVNIPVEFQWDGAESSPKDMCLGTKLSEGDCDSLSEGNSNEDVECENGCLEGVCIFKEY